MAAPTSFERLVQKATGSMIEEYPVYLWPSKPMQVSEHECRSYQRLEVSGQEPPTEGWLPQQGRGRNAPPTGFTTVSLNDSYIAGWNTSLLLQPVADSSDRADKHWLLRVCLEFGPQSPDVHIQTAAPGADLASPHLLYDLFAGHCSPGIAG